MTSPSSRLVFDAFALLAFFKDEPAADRVQEILGGTDALYLSVINLGEVFYKTVRSHGFDKAQQTLSLIDSYPIEILDVDRQSALSAARLKGMYKMSYADCFVTALAQRLDATVVTGDPDFQQLQGQVAIEWLPTAQR